jgi:hypothetical protein
MPVREYGAVKPKLTSLNSGPQGRGFDSLQAHQPAQYEVYGPGLQDRLL